MLIGQRVNQIFSVSEVAGIRGTLSNAGEQPGKLQPTCLVDASKNWICDQRELCRYPKWICWVNNSTEAASTVSLR